MQEILRKIPGVSEDDGGVFGRHDAGPDLRADVCTGATRPRRRRWKIIFDSSRIRLTSALLDYFYRMHDPTTLNRQHNDVGVRNIAPQPFFSNND